jgi:diguanylate cyclase (GGDEF)-like protein
MSNRERTTAEAKERKNIRREPLRQALDAAQAKVDALEKRGTKEGQEREIANDELEAARLDHESYDFERDATGAWKGESLGVDLRNVYDELEGQDGALDVDKAEKFHLIQVNMGELDRINKDYGHKKGDEALGATCGHIYSRVETIVSGLIGEKRAVGSEQKAPSDYFDVYRSAGNDFTILLRDVDGAMAGRIRQALAGDFAVPGIPSEKSPPLAVTHTTLSDAAKYFNAKPKEVGGENPGRAFVDVAKELGQTLNDALKNHQRVDRILKMQDPEQGKVLYDNYLKKSVGKLFSDEQLSYEAFMEAAKTSSDSGLGHSIRQAIEDFKSRKKESLELSESLSGFARELIVRKLGETRTGTENIDWEALLSRKTQAKEGPGREPEPVQDYDGFMGQTEPTGGEKELMGFKHEVARLSALVESDPNNERNKARLKLAESRYHNAEVKRNPATGLYERGMFFGEVKSSLKENRPVTVMSIDMAFLKYFDKEGGLKTGNAAIKVAARILDKVVGGCGFPAQAYRMGGDEFSLVLGTQDSNAIQKIQNEIREEARMITIPALDQARTENYQKEQIQFNFGVHTANSMAKFRDELKDKNIPLRADPQNENAVLEETAEMLFKVADRQLEIEKTVERFVFLVGRHLNNKRPTRNDQEEKWNYGTLFSYSEKALGDKGQRGIEKWAAEYEKNKDIVALRKAITLDIITPEKKEKAQQVTEGVQEDLLVEYIAKDRLLEQMLEDRQAQVNKLVGEKDAAEQNSEDKDQQIESLKAEIIHIGGLRENIKLAA